MRALKSRQGVVRTQQSRLSALLFLAPALVTLAFGFYQVGRPELWRDELASCRSPAAR